MKKIIIPIFIGFVVSSCTANVSEQKNDISKNVDDVKTKQHEFLNTPRKQDFIINNYSDYLRYDPNNKTPQSERINTRDFEKDDISRFMPH
ncbi:hypothetical protein CQ046_13600 [Chryseobacterium sp. MYb7]|uniref:hypothetical protein n=1 Tax=Chryseobacterium sp. MYb7 TaxID=1827290 RepID=UPI000CFE6CF6|nr:hypothetical protein [Chryseobacterium sp. MYb7]PRB01995.1 hypothetical protein CQ046_13600 [Chryseobacterium sp. MYb7]